MLENLAIGRADEYWEFWVVCPYKKCTAMKCLRMKRPWDDISYDETS